MATSGTVAFEPSITQCIEEAYELEHAINQNDYESIKAMFAKDEEAPYRVLEISRSASDNEVKRAFRKMANKYHPDKVSHLGKEMQKLAEDKFKAVNDAYQQIKKDRNIS